MARWRWVALLAAFALALLVGLAPFVRELRDRIPSSAAYSVAMVGGIIVLLSVGAIGMRQHLRSRGAKAPIMFGVCIGAVIAWAVAEISGWLGVAAGPGGLVIGLLVTLPAIVLAPLLQIVALIGFARAERKLRDATVAP